MVKKTKFKSAIHNSEWRIMCPQKSYCKAFHLPQSSFWWKGVLPIGVINWSMNVCWSLGRSSKTLKFKKMFSFFFFCNNEDHLEILEETVGHLIVFFRCTSDLLGVSCIFILMGITWWSNFSWAHVVWTWEWENFGIIGPVAPKSKLEGRHDHLAWDLITNPSHLHLYHAIRSWWIYKK